MGRPRRLNGSRQRVVNLDARAHDEADRIGNFSEWVRNQLHAHAASPDTREEKELVSEISTRRLAAIVMNRVQKMEHEATSKDDEPVDELKEVARAILAWFTAD